jgi:GT2 family glycosyltransferase
MAISLDIVIVNWNSGSRLKDSISSIGPAKRDGLILRDVVIIDNTSTDDSLAGIDLAGVPVKILHNNKNRGFAAACNQGATLTESDYLLFLNPDTCLHENSLWVPLAFMENPDNAHIGICGIQLIDESCRVTRSCARFPSAINFTSQAIGLSKLPWLRASGVHMADWDHASTREVDHVIGAFFLVRRAVFNELNGFDERFFVYLEDLDFSLRARRAGWRSVYLTVAQAFHVGGGSSQRVMATRLFYSLRSRILYGFKHFNIFAATGLMLATLALEPFPRIALGFVRRSRKDINGTIKGFVMLWGAVPILLKSAAKYRKI